MNQIIKKAALAIPPIKRRFDDLENLRAEYERTRVENIRLSQELEKHSAESAYYSCDLINNNFMHFNGSDRVTMCCEPLRIPETPLGATGRETIESFILMRAAALLEGRLQAKQRNEYRIYSQACLRCKQYKQQRWYPEDLISFINFSMSPTQCDARCIYCSYPMKKKEDLKSASVIEGYKRIFNAVAYAKDNGLLTQNVTYQVSSGEITIHPYKDWIMDIVGNSKANIFTNCFRYDERIEANLAANPSSLINLSIDAGTRETWFKIKGRDNFPVVKENLARYRRAGNNFGQITLKYIILPGINDNRADYEALSILMKDLGVRELLISRDIKYLYNAPSEYTEKLIRAAGELLYTLRGAGLRGNLVRGYSQPDRDAIEAVANGILASGRGA